MRDDVLPVLMYHALNPGADNTDHFDPVYSVTAATFAMQLDWLQAQGYTSVRLDNAQSSQNKRVLISFDDGDATNLSVALPLLRARQMVAEFFITSDFVGQAGMLAADDVRELADAGMGVQSHGRSHRFLEDLTEDDMFAELRDSKLRLEAIIGRTVTAIAFPGGRGGNRECDAALRAGYRHVLGSRPGPNAGHGAHECYDRIAITRNLALRDFQALVEWRGLRPRLARARFRVLHIPKRLLGNDRYQRLRARLLAR